MKLAVVSLLLLVPVLGGSYRQERIVGGRDVYPPGKWPWQGSLQVHSPGPGGGTYNHNCGCVVVTDTQVLTAAHCAQGYAVANLRVTLGAHDLETRLEGQPEDYTVAAAEVHENFTNIGALGFPDDVAVLTLGEPINLDNSYIDVINMADHDLDDEGHAGQECIITGWGRQTGGGPLANILKETDIDVLTNTFCRTMWSQVNDGHVCVYDEQNQESGACNGDSGGPLVCRETPDDSWELVGLTSWGSSGCSTTSPSVYSRVAYFRDWFDWALEQTDGTRAAV